MSVIYETNFKGLCLQRRGKVRDLYDLGDKLLIVATDRISAFDVIMRQPVPNKGKILSQISKFWFEKTAHIIPNHLISTKLEDYPDILLLYKNSLKSRSMLVTKATPFPIECVVRGYLAGSGWKEYLQNRTVCGISLPEGLEQYGILPEPIFTPATKAEHGHDENITFDRTVGIIGHDDAAFLKSISIKLYQFAHDYLFERGIILADTKFEFGRTDTGEIILIDEVLTPDSSRFWLKENWAPGKEQYNFDKQILRDHLESIAWDKTPPPPELPEEILYFTLEKYIQAYELITEKPWSAD